MARTKRVTILLEEWEYEQLKQKAGIASMSAYIKNRLEECWCQKTVLDHVEAENHRAEDVPRSRTVRRGRRGVAAHEYAAYVAAQLEASVNPERDPVPDIEESRARKSEKTCPHGYAVGWRCTLCGGVVK